MDSNIYFLFISLGWREWKRNTRRAFDQEG